MADNSRVVQVGVAPNETIALWWKEILEDDGIRVMLKPGGIGHGYFANALNEHYIMVLESQAELAVEILNELMQDDAEEFASEQG